MESVQIKKRYYFISVIVFFLGFMLLVFPFKKNKDELSPENLLLAITNNDRFYSPDEVARLIISGDPSIQLIDVRTPKQYADYNLPNSINIPLSAILDKDDEGYFNWEAYFDDDNKTNILYSNGSVYANQVWMLTKRLNYKNNYVMKGGLNAFFETIILPKKISTNASQKEIDLHQFRKGASMYFGGGGVITESASESEKPVKLPVKKKKKKKAEESGGC